MSSGDFSTSPRACHDPSADGALSGQRPPDLQDLADEGLAIDKAEGFRRLRGDLIAREADFRSLLVAVDAEVRGFREAEFFLEAEIEVRTAQVDLLRFADDRAPILE